MKKFAGVADIPLQQPRNAADIRAVAVYARIWENLLKNQTKQSSSVRNVNSLSAQHTLRMLSHVFCA